MQKYIKLKDMLALNNLNNLYMQEFTCRKCKGNDTTIEFHFDFNDLSEAEQLGYSCYINQLESRLFIERKGIAKYIKSIHQDIGKITKYKYEFYTEEEYKKRKFKKDLKFGLQIAGIIIAFILAIVFVML